MLYLIAVWLILLPVCAAIGQGLLAGLGTTLPRSGDRWIVSLWLGLISLAVGLMAVSLWLPLSLPIGLLVSVGLMGLGFLSPTTRQEFLCLWQQPRRRQRVIMLASVLVGVAAVMNRGVVWLDSGYYHYSSIQWLAQYGTVRGIALLFSNLGFTSSWFALIAPWNPIGVAAHGTVVMAGFVGLISLLHLLIVTQRIQRADAQLSDWFAFLFLGSAGLVSLAVKPFSQILISPSPDLPVLLLVGTVSWAFLIGHDRAIPMILAAGAVTIKLTALPLLLVSGLFFLATRPFSSRRTAIGAMTVWAILLPNMTASVMTSGCPLYPATSLCFDLPWSPTSQAAQQIASNTHNWITWYGTPPTGAIPWLWAIGQMIQKSPKEGIILGFVVLALGVAIVMLKNILKTQSPGSVRVEIWVCAIGVVGLMFLMSTSIFLRFLLPYILVLLALMGAKVLMAKSITLVKWSVPQMTIGMIAVSSLALSLNLYQTKGQAWLLPPPMPQDRITYKQTNGIDYAAPVSGDVNQTAQITNQLQKDMCWAATIPCAYNISPEIHLRDADRGISGGFVRR
jgi:hypothetical protein